MLAAEGLQKGDDDDRLISCARATRGFRRPSNGRMARLGVPEGWTGKEVACRGDHNNCLACVNDKAGMECFAMKCIALGETLK